MSAEQATSGAVERMKRQGVPIPPEVRAKIVAMYRMNSARLTARTFGVDIQSVLNIVRAAGEPVRAPYQRVAPTKPSQQSADTATPQGPQEQAP